MRKFLYLSLIERLKQLTGQDGQPVIRTFDLWNEQVSFLEQEEPFAVPAVFIEFLPVKWNTLSGNAQRAEVTLRLHIVTSWDGSSRDGSEFQQQSLDRFDLLDRIDRHLFNLMGKNKLTEFNMFRRTGSSTNHNHEELVEDIGDYTCMVMDSVRTATVDASPPPVGA